jgi:thymidine kinase
MSMGYLELIIGPMFSGKTTALMNIYDRNILLGKSVCVVNYSGDTRYHESMLSTHDKRMIPCVFASTLRKIFSDDILRQDHISDVILINEGQFFSDLHEVVMELVEQYGKSVYICGLDGDFKRNKFGQLLDLIPLCDKVDKLRSNCHMCNNNAIFSHRITNECDQVVIGSTNYVPLCRVCYNKSNVIKT